MTDAARLKFITDVAEMLRRELGSHGGRVKQEASGVRCAMPRIGGFFVVNVTTDRVYWETVPAGLNDSRDVHADADWQTALQDLEHQVRSWSATL